jgi:RimJ/RimL family protein N-acetyltransferase
MAGERRTQRLLLRPPTPADRALYHAHFTQPAIERWLRPPPLPRFETNVLDELVDRDCAHWSEHGFGPWIVIERASGAFAGRGGLAWTSVEDTAEVELPWSVEPRLQGRGIATEAARAAALWAGEMHFRQVVALVLPTNSASRRVADKTGFKADGEVVHAGLPHTLFRLGLA